MKISLTTFVYEDAPALNIEPESELEAQLLHHLLKKNAVLEQVQSRREAPAFAGISASIRIPRKEKP